MECSGQICHYVQKLHNGHGLYEIHINTSRTETSKNYMSITIDPSLHYPTKLDLVSEYVKVRFEELGGLLITFQAGKMNEDVRLKKAIKGDPYPSKIQVLDYRDARNIIDDLFKHKDMTEIERADIENALRELEKSADYASHRFEKISVAQKEIIQNMISPYIDDIKAEISDEIIIKCYLDIASSVILLMSETPSIVRAFLPNILSGNYGFEWGEGALSSIPELELHRERSADFYDSLIFVAKFYSSMGNFEETLKQLGEGLPSEVVIQQSILELFR